MGKLLIVGAGGHGRCCLDIARDVEKFDAVAFLDNKYVNQTINGCEVIDSADNMNKYHPQYDSIFIAIGNNELRYRLMEEALKIGFKVVTLISPYSYVSKYAKIGKGSVVFQNSVVEANSFIGEGCIITSNVTVNHDASINDYCLIYSNSVIRAEAQLGKFCKIGSNCCVGFSKVLLENATLEDMCNI